MCHIPMTGIITAYVDNYIGDVISQGGSCFVLFYNEDFAYWHLACGRIVPADYDTKAKGLWGRV